MNRYVDCILIALATSIVGGCGSSSSPGESPVATPSEVAQPAAEGATSSGATEPAGALALDSAEALPEAGVGEIDLGEGWLGVALEGVPIEAPDGSGAIDGQMVRITQVFPDTPAATSDFRAGDVVLSFGDHALVDVADLVTRVRASSPGTTVDVTLRRADEELVQPVMLGLRPEFDDLLISIFLDRPAPPVTANRLVDDAAVSIGPGEVVVLDFWATWCGPCRRALPGLNALYARFAPHGVRVIGVSPEEPEVLREFVAETPIDFTVAYDVNHETSHSYFITAYPTLFVIDRDGTVRHVFVGSSDLPEVEASLEALVAEGSSQ